MAIINWCKAALVSLLLLTLSGSLTGCGVGAKQQAVYDDDSQIVQDGDSYSFSRRIGTMEENELALEYGRFYGVQTIWSIDAASDQKLRIEFDSAVEHGKFKLVLVSPNDELLIVLEQGAKAWRNWTFRPGNTLSRSSVRMPPAE